jgi:hypothetical protein
MGEAKRRTVAEEAKEAAYRAQDGAKSQEQRACEEEARIRGAKVEEILNSSLMMHLEAGSALTIRVDETLSLVVHRARWGGVPVGMIEEKPGHGSAIGACEIKPPSDLLRVRERRLIVLVTPSSRADSQWSSPIAPLQRSNRGLLYSLFRRRPKRAGFQ